MANLQESQGTEMNIDNAHPTPRAKIQIRYLLLALLSLLIPLVISVVVLAQRRWFPANLDFAWTEFRVRDVGTARSPLIGLPGRIGTMVTQGSHPGPISFYLLAPLYRLLGSSTWALRASAVGLNFAGLIAVLLIARRRGGAIVFLGVFATAALLIHFLGASILTMPWNPYMPVIWWMVFLLAAWSVLLDDLPMLPVLAFAGAFCVQTHISYLGLVGGVSALVVGWMIYSVFKRRGVLGEHPLRWIAISVALNVMGSCTEPKPLSAFTILSTVQPVRSVASA